MIMLHMREIINATIRIFSKLFKESNEVIYKMT